MTNVSTISWCKFGWETGFMSESTAYDKAFGHGIRINSVARKNNIEPVYSTGSRNAQKLTEKKFEGALSIEFILANPWFFRAVLGAAPTTGGAGPYTHSWAESDTVVSFSVENDIQSDTASVAQFLGCKVATCTITAAVGELVRVRLDCPYRTEEEGSSTSAQVNESFELFTFAQASLEFPNGSTITDIQNVEVTINNNPEYTWGLGSRFAQNGPVKNRQYSARISRTFEDAATFLETFYGAATGPNATVAETTTMELLFTNSLTGTNERLISLLFTGVKIDEHNLPQDPTALIIEDLPIVMRSLAISATNNTSAAP